MKKHIQKDIKNLHDILSKTSWRFGGGRWIREPRTKKHATGMFFAACWPPSCSNPAPRKNPRHPHGCRGFLVGEGGFEPPKSLTADLQSVPFGHSGIPPYSLAVLLRIGAGRRTRTPDLLITNQLLYQLSYTGVLKRQA